MLNVPFSQTVRVITCNTFLQNLFTQLEYMAYLNKNVDAVRLQTAKKAYMYEGSVYNSNHYLSTL